MNNIIKEYIDWALATFPDETLAQQALHLLKETKELEAAPDDIKEKADVYMLASLIQYRLLQTTSVSDLLSAVAAKLEINRRRRWARTAEGDYARIVPCPRCGGDLIYGEGFADTVDYEGRPVEYRFKCNVCVLLFQRSEVSD